MSAELLALLDRLDAARGKATPGEWAQHPADPSYVLGEISDDGESYLDVADCDEFADAELIVAAVNNLPKLTAALRTVLEAVDEWERNAGPVGDGRIPRWLVATVLRGVIADALTPEQAPS